MPLQTTQKFPSPIDEEKKFSAQLERFTQSVALEVNSKINYDYGALEQATGAAYLFLQKRLPVFAQSLSVSVDASLLQSSLFLQSPNQGIVFLAYTGFIEVSGNSYPVPYYDGTNSITFYINSGGQITVNATTLFIGGTLTLTVQYAYSG